MLPARRIHLFVAALLFVSLSCANLPVFSVPDTGAISTSAAQTVIAGLTQNSVQASPSAIPTFTATLTSEPPTITPTETLTPTQTLTATLVFTPTPLVPLISVSTPTNCRNGPGKVYDMVGALLVGEFAEVYGRDPTNNYWYIRNPDSRPEFCWVWGEYATLIGPFALLPVFTPPPTPTPTFTPSPTVTPKPSPAFRAEYVGLDRCKRSWWAEIELRNRSSVPLKSVSISLTDKTTGVVVANLSDGFTNLDGCLVKTTKDILRLDDTFLLSSPAFDYNPTGHKIVTVITLCSGKGQKGMCLTKRFSFIP
jgi:hypothetical protein